MDAGVTTKAELPDDLRVCNCSWCGRLLLGRRDEDWALALAVPYSHRPSPDWSEVNGRPVCLGCRKKYGGRRALR